MSSYDYDLVVIGGGSGGLACSKEAAKFGAKVACLDFVVPSPQGTTWGLGGTCVNVGCIPKKLFHQAGLLGEAVEDAKKFGWQITGEKHKEIRHDWETLVSAVRDHIGSLNWGYKVALRDAKVSYLNALGVFTQPHTLSCTDKKGKVTVLTAERFVVAVGGRPRYPDIPGAREYGITSDDLFTLAKPPGKTLVVGASYVALECAGFLTSLGYHATVMARSIFLRGFDQQMAEKIVEYMAAHGTEFLRQFIPTKIEKVMDEVSGTEKLRVTATNLMLNTTTFDDYDTVLFAIGRDPNTRNLGLEAVGVATDPATGKIQVVHEQTNVPYIYALGDVLLGKPELTPVAIQAGKLLARRLYNNEPNAFMDYVNVPTAVFTPLEYGAIGLSEEDAIAQMGEANIETFHTSFTPLEWTVPHHEENACYAKLICDKTKNLRVLGFHILGPNAGEVTQGYGLAFKLGATKSDFDNTIGIHPTVSETFTTLDITKSSGVDASSTGC